MYSGSCLCDAVRYEVRGEIGDGYFCHCSRCRKATGAAFAASAMVATKDFVITQGEAVLKSFSSSPGVYRIFCGECGSPIISRRDATPDIVRVRLGTLDTPLPHGLQGHIFVGSKANWLEIHDGLPQYEKFPPA